MRPLPSRRFWVALFAGLLAYVAAGAETSKTGKGGARPDAAQRAAALKRVCERLGIGVGMSIADVGCGNGGDTLTFAEVVGPTGKVFGQEIEQKLLDAMMQKARERKLTQVQPVLGATEDPRLPDGVLDLIYMHQVFHHFAKPSSMLSNLWIDLKPGGWLVIVDRQKGPQREWPDLAAREKKHFWTGETTVVRLAREAGFLFASALDDLWMDKEPFVLVFRKPAGIKKPAGDPDLPLAINGKAMASALPALPPGPATVLFAGLDQGRLALPALRQQFKSRPVILDVVLEEWTTQNEELPSDLRGNASGVVRLVKGDLPEKTGGGLQAAVFADSYSRLWDPAPLLRRLRQELAPGGYVAVMDRHGPEGEPRRLAGHHRHIAPGLVKADFEKAGFALAKELKPPAADRFFLLFRPAAN